MTKERAPYEAMTIDQAFAQAQHLLEGRALPYGAGDSTADARITRTLLVAGPPRSGKTEFALKVLYGGKPGIADKTAYDEATPAGAVMIVSNRTIADDLSLRVIRDVKQTSLARPVTTLAALAFRIISTMRVREGLPLPKLLNGAEQDAILRSVLAAHVAHVRAGDQCETCRLLAAYFASSNWTGLVSSQDGTNTDTPGNDPDDARDASTDELFERGISDVFITQLRDMLARMNELGASSAKEDAIIATLAAATGDAGIRGERLATQWRAAFALRREYIAAINRIYPDEYRLDASRLLVEGTEAVRQALREGLPPADAAIPRVVIVDDAQDLTLAGMAFLQAIERSGGILILIGNPDEAVQGFRGSYPEFLFLRATEQPLDGDDTADDDAADEMSAMVNDRNLGRLGAFAIRLVPAQTGASHAASRSDAPADTDAHADVWTSSDSCAYSYRDLVAARTSLGILSLEPTSIPLADRLGKMPQWPGAAPILPLARYDGEKPPAVPSASPDGSVRAALYRSAGEELDDVVWHMLHAHTIDHRSWNDMAVIAHDNSTVRVFGERLRREGIPVHYSSVTKPLKDEPFVQGLFAIIELALLRERGINSTTMNARALATFVRSRMRMLLGSPLVSVTTAGGARHPLRVSAINAAMNSLESLSRVLVQNDRSDVGAATGRTVANRALLHAMMDDWFTLRERLSDAERTRDGAVINVDDSLMGGGSPEDATTMGFGVDAMNLLLAEGGEPADRVVRAIHSVLGSRDAKPETDDENSRTDTGLETGPNDGEKRARIAWTDPEAATFERAWVMIDAVAEKLRTMPLREARYVLWEAWQAADVAERWQRQALRDDADGRAADDRLDTAMRLFQFAESSGAQHDVTAFMEQVRAMELEADSLAHVRPVEEAVTLTTPAGAIGRSWPLVWMPAVQQGVWPNLAARNTMFGVDDLADVMLHGRLASSLGAEGSGDVAAARSEQVASVLYGEKRSFLMAITRAETQVQVSAVSDDDHVPSDFLYGFMPELFVREDPENENRPFTRYTEVGQAERYHGLELSVRGIVTEARAILAAGRDAVGDDAFRDAADTLRFLKDEGIPYADPENWPFVDAARETVARKSAGAGDDLPDDAVVFETKSVPDGLSKQDRERLDEQTGVDRNKSGARPVVRLSPSAVDGIWNCPVCWLMDNQFVGPRPSSVATSFGTIIHAVAERASAEGLDLPAGQPGTTPEEKTAAITDRMLDIYAELRVDPEDIPSVAERYDAMYKDRSAGTLLRHIAEYFVNSAEAMGGSGVSDNGAYGRQGAKTPPIPIGNLESVTCEKPFLARFDLDRILTAYNATPGVTQVGRDDLYGMLGALVGGWPKGMSKDLQVCISGRMDREETRVMDDGTRQLRLIDYKTGKSRSAKQNFSDLQLVCYQLGEQFDDQLRTEAVGSSADGQPRKLPEIPFIGQSGLFFVKDKASPSYSHAAESCHQPALFRDGHINDQPFTPRYYAASISKLFDEPVLPTVPKENVSEAAWKILLDMRGTQTIWALTMIARVLYAAGAVQSARLVADPDDEHVKHCWHKDACPACADDITSVLEVR
ncbi:PD-(D/E)XK nuclease family protein [Bifidobacterium callimiconis]|uniref:PD-(D/E)XK nuclease family protein n=1 Tax=Bifidobacterium callimiconis TaxID=2306973 RepID=UPI001BDCECD9|nr:PD-(D/E)XK nuclease family protein [Bifidobacterium callimiconis]MBT1176560.1 PD-(D/E)XK nuclease family protein [Bifidobacterium callimiconis]